MLIEALEIILLIFIAILTFLHYYRSKYIHQEQQQHLAQQIKQHQDALLKLELVFSKIDNQHHTLKEALLSQVHQTMQGVQTTMTDVRSQIQSILETHSKTSNIHLKTLHEQIQSQVNGLQEQLDQRVKEHFHKTSDVFTQVVERLTKIDTAQQDIASLSGQVVDLKQILSHQTTRGLWGEMQLERLMHNALPKAHFSLQHTLSNGKRVDCLLKLPSGDLAIDAKFPLNNYPKDPGQPDPTKRALFIKNMKQHISDIAKKYIIRGETAPCAILFIPAEALFSDIHAHYLELVDFSQKNQVWLTSPSTLMAVLTTAAALIKDMAIQDKVHLIQKHIAYLHEDFVRFQTRMDNLSKHVRLMSQDVEQIHMSGSKIAKRFSKIEQADIKAIQPTHAGLNETQDFL